MFKIGLENRDFCKSLHFYIVDAEKKKKKKKKNELHLLASSAALLCCGALASALIYILVPKTIEIIWICAAHNFFIVL